MLEDFENFSKEGNFQVARNQTFSYHALLKVCQSPEVTSLKQNFRVIKKMFSQIISQYVSLLLENVT